MTKLNEKESAMVSAGSDESKASRIEPKYCERCGKELKESDKNVEEKYNARFCSDCVFAIKIYSRPEF